MKSRISDHMAFPEPKLTFHPDRSGDIDVHPLRGLLKYGPYSSGLVPTPIRVATIAPFGESKILYSLMKELNLTFKPNERRDYLPEWLGFSRTFNLRIQAAPSDCRFELSRQLEGEIEKAESAYVVLTNAIQRAIQSIEGRRSDFDILFIYLPQRWARGFAGVGDDDFDLHDHLKAITAMRGLPIQIVREDKAITYPDRASVMWRLGLAIYAKAGGVPWKLAAAEPDIAYIGISYALRPVDSNRPRFVTCCSQVFDAEGAGIEFIAYDAHEVEVHRDNPFLSRAEMFRVMSRSLDLYRRRHAGRSPRRVMVHKTTQFKPDEIDGAMEALHLCEAVDLLQVVQDVPWKGVLIEGRPGSKKGHPAAFPVGRGTVIGLSPRESLIWTHGDVGGISQRGRYFQGSRGTPRPLRLVRHAGHGGWDDTARAVLALSKMNWNNDALYDPLPVTLRYAEMLARVVKRISGLGARPYQFRYFM